MRPVRSAFELDVCVHDSLGARRRGERAEQGADRVAALGASPVCLHREQGGEVTSVGPSAPRRCRHALGERCFSFLLRATRWLLATLVWRCWRR